MVAIENLVHSFAMPTRAHNGRHENALPEIAVRCPVTQHR